MSPGSTVVSLLRLWALRKAGASHAVPSVRASVCLAAIWLLLWVVIDWCYARPQPQFFIDNTPLFAWYGLAVLGLAAVLRWRSRPTPAFGAVLALAVGLVPVPVLIEAVAAPFVSPTWLIGLTIAGTIYALFYLARGLRAFTGSSQFLAALAGVAFSVGFIWLTDSLDVIPDVWAPLELAAPIASSDDTLADEEDILFRQAGRIDQALDSIKVDATANSRAFFLGFAGVGDEKVFAQEIALASQVLGKRYHIADRSLSLVNDQRDLEQAPLASVSGLKYSLRGMAARMNLDRDVLFLSISSHGSPDPVIAVANSQLPLNDLTEQALADALSESGIRWRVIIISACYAGAFIESLKNPQTIVVTAAAADRTSFGCGSDSDLTYFGSAFYRDSLPKARSLRDAFDKATAAIAVRERHERIEASKPQAYFGAEMDAKLTSMSGPGP
jgi:Peptidase C13 family